MISKKFGELPVVRSKFLIRSHLLDSTFLHHNDQVDLRQHRQRRPIRCKHASLKIAMKTYINMHTARPKIKPDCCSYFVYAANQLSSDAAAVDEAKLGLINSVPDLPRSEL